METQLFLGLRPMKKRMLPITNTQFVKPRGGIWTSTFDPVMQCSEWVEWTRDINYYKHAYHFRLRWWLVQPRQDARIYTVDSLADLLHLTKWYALPNPLEGYALTLYTRTHLDYERMADDYDAIHLTSAGQDATRLTFPESLYGWDVESTLWFRWRFAEVSRCVRETPTLAAV